MAGSMSRADLSADLTASLNDVAEVFSGDAGAIDRFLNAAAQDFNRHRPRTLLGTLTAIPGQMIYPAPDNIHLFKSSLWGIAPVPHAKPWERTWTGPMAKFNLVDGVGGKELHLTPAPSELQVAALGSEVRFYYFGKHSIETLAAETTIDSADRWLLLLRAQAECMREMVNRNIKKPVQMRDGLNSAPKNMTPSAWCEKLLNEWEMKMGRLSI